MSNTLDTLNLQIVFTSGLEYPLSLELSVDESGLISASFSGRQISISSLSDLQALQQSLQVLEAVLAYLSVRTAAYISDLKASPGRH